MERKPDRKMIDRINELGRLAKVRPLTEKEGNEQQELRAAYIAWFRTAIRADRK